MQKTCSVAPKPEDINRVAYCQKTSSSILAKKPVAAPIT